MSRVTDLVRHLPERHVEALRWFEDHQGQEVPWPQPLDDGTLLATKAKGIYKPHWSSYALSVRQSLSGPYPDGDVQSRSDGTWRYLYFQENLDLVDRDSAFTNLGLLACYQDTVPVGVLRQTRGKPNVRYQVLGLAFVNGWEDGYFVLDGVDPAKGLSVRDPHPNTPENTYTFADTISAPFDLEANSDERARTLKEVRVRQGQAGFRSTLLKAYRGRCAVTDYDAEEALEAAHILPYRGPLTNHPQNGLLLRADLHSLFDLGLLAVHEVSMRVITSVELRGTAYEQFTGCAIATPSLPQLHPSRLALGRHRQNSQL